MATLLGMLPFSFTATSHLVVTATLAMMVFLTVTIDGIARNGFGCLKLFALSGVPHTVAPASIPPCAQHTF